MKDKIDIESLVLGALLGTAILVTSSTAGCATSQQATSAKDHTGQAVVSSRHGDTIQTPVLDAAQSCRAMLRRIYGAKHDWAVENRKTFAEVPTDAELFGPGRYMPEKPKCPSGGIYTLGAVEENPRCSIPMHIY